MEGWGDFDVNSENIYLKIKNQISQSSHEQNERFRIRSFGQNGCVN